MSRYDGLEGADLWREYATSLREAPAQLRAIAADIEVAHAMSASILRLIAADVEVLRALTGAPTADVASCIKDASCEEGDHTRSWPCDYAPGAGRLTAAPEGVDAADELAEALDNARYASELDENTLYETVRVLAAGVRERQETFATELARGMRHPRLVICPARVHSSFLIDSDDMVSCPWCPADEPDGMGLEAQGEMADKLAAAQAEVKAARVASKQIEEWWKADRAQLAERGRERDAALAEVERLRKANAQLAHDLAASVQAKAGYSRMLRGMARKARRYAEEA